MPRKHSLLCPNFFLILTILLLFINLSQEKSELKNLPGKKFTTQEEITQYLKTTDLTILVFYYKTGSENAEEIAGNLKIVYSKLKYLIELISVNCDNNFMEECTKSEDNLMDEEFYRIEIYVPPLYKQNPYTKELNSHQKLQYAKSDISDKALYKFLTKTIISREQVVTNENYENFKTKANLNKVILFTNKKSSPLMYRGLSGYFYDRISLGIVYETEKALCKKLGIKKFPTLMVIQTMEDDVIIDDPVEIIYDGKMDTENIVNFLEKYALKEKLYISEKQGGWRSPIDKYLIYFNKLSAEKVMDFMKKKKEKEVILYFDNNVKDGKITYDYLSSDIKEFNSETHGFFHFGYVDCTGEEKEKICKNSFKIKEFPNMVLYRPEKEIKEKISKGYELPLELSNIRREINILFEPNVKSANALNFQYMITESVQNKKIVLLYLFDGIINFGFSLITQKKLFSDFIDFIVMDQPSDEIKRKLQARTLPNMNIIIPDATKVDQNGNPQTQFMVYGGKLSFSALDSFLKTSFQLTEKEANPKSQSKEDKKPTEITFIQTTKELEETCTKKKLCIIGFFDMRPGDLYQKNFEDNFKIFKNFTEMSKKRPTTFGYINATCQEEFSSKFGINIESLPSIIVYSYTKDVYANLVGSFIEDDMNELINKAVSGRINFQRIQKDNAILQDIKCETIQPFVESDDDDDIMKELLDEEKRKREEFDMERNAEEESKKKKKKKKKDKKDKKKKKDKNSDL
jgi:hypothetical protein